MTSQLRSDFDKFLIDQGNIELNEDNIKELISMLIINRGNILENSIPEVFDMFTKFYNENRCHIEGWKTNNRFKVNKKIILPGYVSYNDSY